MKSQKISNAHNGPVTAITYSKKLKLLISGGIDGKLITWRGRKGINGQTEFSMGNVVELNNGSFLSIHNSSNDQVATADSFGNLSILNIVDLTCLYRYNITNDFGGNNYHINKIHHTPQLGLIGVLINPYGFYFLNYYRSQMSHLANNGPAFGNAFDICESRELLITNSGPAIYLYSLRTGKQICVFGGQPKIIYYQNGLLQVTPDPGLAVLHKNLGWDKDVVQLFFHNQGKWFIAAHHDYSLRRWKLERTDPKTEKQPDIIGYHHDVITSLMIDFESDNVLSGDLTGEVKIWDTYHEKLISNYFADGAILCMALSEIINGDKTLAIGTSEGSILFLRDY